MCTLLNFVRNIPTHGTKCKTFFCGIPTSVEIIPTSVKTVPKNVGIFYTALKCPTHCVMCRKESFMQN